MKRVDLTRPRLLAAGGLCLVAIAYGVGLGVPALFDEPNDGQYAEVAREMIVSGDWISPHLNFVLFLNKPPLLYWLIAASYTLFGMNEAAARLPGLLTLLATLVLLYRLAEELFDGWTALSAAALFAAMPSIYWEARSVRPDLLITATTVAALLAFVIAARSTGKRQARALVGLQIALALGLLAKGMVALVLPAMPIAAVVLVERRWDLLRLLIHPRRWWLFFALVIPWHAITSWRHTGFFWDYVVNQHLLFFLDRKEPRDSVPIPLPLFWLAVMMRLFPWTWTVPPALVFMLRRLTSEPARRGAFVIPLMWAAGTLGFFSLTVSRLEHYALPALPALALMIAVVLHQGPAAGARWRTVIIATHLLTAGSLITVALVLPRFLAADPWLRRAPDIVNIPGPYFGIMAAAWIAASVLALRVPAAGVLIACAACLATTPFVRRGFAAFAPVNSSAPVAEAIARVATADTHVVFEAPIEYQLVAGLNFYLRRPVLLLRPPGFVEPTYLLPHRDLLFIDRGRFIELWQRNDVIFVSDPLADADRPVTDVVPTSHSVIARIGNRWIIRNRSTYHPRGSGEP